MNGQQSFEALSGLPPYGPLALSFSATGMGSHSEGFVVRFIPASGETWIGNFNPGLSSLSTVVCHPNEAHIIVVAGGTGYVVDPISRQVLSNFGGQITLAQELSAHQAVLFGNGLWFELLGRDGFAWRSNRVSWDGMKDIAITEQHIIGKAWCFDDTWHEFKVSLASGAAEGGAYVITA
ncbi:MAG: hypothetical protein JSR34_03205 [Proteobacteria bacterium]|nr:hypothetical protein [Pseudomonadota bacterium]